MKRIGVYAILLGTALASFAAAATWYLASYQGGGGSLGGLMGQMMGRGGTVGMTYTLPPGLWVILVVFVGIAVLGALGVGYYVAFPEIRPGPARDAAPPSEPANPVVGWDVLMRTSKPEEKKVLEVLASHDGSYLQKFVVKEAGLSRLKTHRIVSRLAERGVVTVERSGNTNQVSLAPWVTRRQSTPPGSVSSGA